MRVGQSVLACLALVALSLHGVYAVAADVSVQAVAKDLSAPSSIAIRPGGSAESYEVFIADTAAGRIVSLVNNQPELGSDVVIGFDAKVEKSGSHNSAGPRGLAFLDSMRLVVAGGENHVAYVRLYELRESDKTLQADQYSQNVEPPAADDSPDSTIGGFLALARTLANEQVPDLIVATALGDKRVAPLWKVPVRANTLGELEIFGVAAPRVDSVLAAGVAVGTHGYVVSSGAAAESNSSQLEFRNPIDGTVALKLKVDLPGIVGLAYSPITGKLYAASATPGKQGQGGIYRIDDIGKSVAPACKVVKIATAQNPTALAFGPDGALWVTTAGDSNMNAKDGVLLKLTGEL